MSFLRRLFGRSRLTRTLTDEIWADGEKLSGSVRGSGALAGVEIDINLLTWSIAKLSEVSEGLSNVTVPAGKVPAIAEELFVLGLYYIAGSVQEGGGGKETFRPICDALVRRYQAQLEPVAKGKLPRSLVLSPASFADVAGDPDAKAAVMEGMAHVLTFLRTGSL